jgi:HPt (histidine-containing phosphotransfer) domain-containing protein
MALFKPHIKPHAWLDYTCADYAEIIDIDKQLNTSNDQGNAPRSSTQKILQDFHEWVNKKKSTLIYYFQYAIAAIQPTSEEDNSFPYYLKDIELVKEDIRFIVRHLGRALGWQANETKPYKELIFGTCQAIEKKNDNTGEFMHEIYMRLLDDKAAGINQLKAALLGPFRKWLDDHNIKRAHYTLSGNASFFTVRKLEIFTQSRQTKIDSIKLTEFEKANLR